MEQCQVYIGSFENLFPNLTGFMGYIDQTVGTVYEEIIKCKLYNSYGVMRF